MAKEINGPEALTEFNATASAETRAAARKQLDKLVEAYAEQSDILVQTFKGNTRFNHASDDQAMAREISVQLDRLSMQVQLAALVCARLDGVDVNNMISDIENIIQAKSPQIRKPGPWG